jgi:hypothetical protein
VIVLESRSEAGELLTSNQITDAGIKAYLVDNPAVKAALPANTSIEDVTTEENCIHIRGSAPLVGRVNLFLRLAADEPG